MNTNKGYVVLIKVLCMTVWHYFLTFYGSGYRRGDFAEVKPRQKTIGLMVGPVRTAYVPSPELHSL